MNRLFDILAVVFYFLMHCNTYIYSKKCLLNQLKTSVSMTYHFFLLAAGNVAILNYPILSYQQAVQPRMGTKWVASG